MMIHEVIAAWTVLAITIPAFYFTGQSLRSLIKSRGHSPVMEGVLSTALGMGIAGHGFAFAGHLGWLGPFSVIWAVVAWAAGLRSFSSFTNWGGQLLKCFRSTSSDSFFSISNILFLLVLVLVFFCALLPEIANDALCYQLFLPRQFLLRGNTAPITYDLNSYIPMLMNHLYAAGLYFHSVPAAKYMHLLSGLLAMFAVMEAAKKEAVPPDVARVIAIGFFMTPTLINQITTTYIDGAATLFAFLSFYMLSRALLEKTGKREFFLAGLFFGFSVSTKILALIACVPIGMMLLLSLIVFQKNSLKNFSKASLFVALGAGLGAGFWFLRNAFLTGNPFYPYLGNLFGTREFHFVEQFQSMGLPKNPFHYFALPLEMTFRPDYFDRGHWIGPLYLFLFPFFLLAVLKNPRMRFFAFYTWCFTTVWFLFFHNARFLFQVLPIYLVAAAWGAAFFLQRTSPLRRRIFWGGAGSILFFLTCLSFYHYRLQFYPLLGLWDQKVYLSKVERSFPAAEWSNNHLPKGSKLLNMEEIRMYYFNAQSLRETWLYLNTDYPTYLKSPEEFLVFLKEQGFTHILRTGSFDSSVDDAPRYLLLRGLLTRTDLIKPLVTIASENIREVNETYTFYQIL